MNKPTTIEEYIASFPENIQIVLEQLCSTIRQAAPQAEETISYGMPSFKLNGKMIWFGAFSKHIGFYPKVTETDALSKELSNYKGTKGSVHFSLDKPMPLKLISDMVKIRLIGY